MQGIYQIIIKLISKQLDQKRDQVIPNRSFQCFLILIFVVVKMAPMDPSFETRELKDNILVRDWMNWLVCNILTVFENRRKSLI